MAAFDQLLAIDVNTPSQTQLAAAQASEAQTQSQLSRATLPYAVQSAKAQASSQTTAAGAADLSYQQQLQYNTALQSYLKRQTSQLEAQAPANDQGAASPLAGATPAPPPAQAPAPLFDPQIQAVMQGIDPSAPTKWDAQMTTLANNGVPEAQQYVGRYSADRLKSWRGAIGTHAVSQAGQAAQSSPLATAPAPTSQLAGGAPTPVTSALTGQPDQDLTAMSVLNPEGTGKLLAMQGMIKYQQTGDPAVLARYAPEMYEKLTAGFKNATETQKAQVEMRASQMGQQANAVLTLAHQLGPDAPEVRAAYNQAVISAAQNKWITPEVAQKELSSPIDFAQLSYLATASQTVSDFARTSGQEAANVARAQAENRAPEWDVAPLPDANGAPIFYNKHAAAAPGATGAQGAPTQTWSPSGPYGGFAAKVFLNEASNNPNARNPMPGQTAGGPGGFIDSTWIGDVAKYRPDLVGNKTAEQINADPALKAQIVQMKFDPRVAVPMIQAEAASDAAELQAEHIPVTDGALAMKRILGDGDFPKVIGAPANAPLRNILSPKVLAANPTWANMTAGQLATSIGNQYAAAPNAAPGAATGSDGLTGQAYLATLAPAMRNQVQAVIDGRMTLPNTGRLNGFQQAVMQNVQRVDPTFDFVNAPARAAVRKDFTSGKSAQAVTSYNTAIGHLDQLDHAIDGLGNGGFTWFNAPSQAFASATGNPHVQAALGTFAAAKGAVSSELVKALRGSTGAEADVKYWNDKLDAAGSPAQLKAVVREAANLLGSRIDALTDQYNTGMGTAAKNPPGLTQQATTSLDRLRGLNQTASTGAPITATGPGGQRVQWDGQQWKPI